MRQLVILSVILTLLTSCSSVAVPQVGAPVPCQIQSVEQVEQAVIAGLAAQNWQVISSSFHIVEARKAQAQMRAMVHIAYGYRGFSIEYFDSTNMNYDIGSDTIGVTYEKWVYRLMHAIEKNLKQEVAQSPPVKCYGEDAPR